MLYIDHDLQRVGGHFNDGGTIKTLDDFDLFYNIDGEIVKFPKKQNLILNLDSQSFLTNTVAGSSFATGDRSRFSFWNDNTQIATMGNIDNSNVYGADKMIVNTQIGYWCHGANFRRTNVRSTQNDFGGSAFSITTTIQFMHLNDWKDVWWLQDSTGLRLEYGGGQLHIFSDASGFRPLDIPFPQTSSDKCIVTITYANGVIKAYINGAYVSQTSLSSVPASNRMYINCNRGGQGNSLGTHFFRLTYHNAELTEAEVRDLAKIDRLLNVGLG